MALIGRIRKNSWLLIVVIGLALAAFVLMDMTSASNRAGANSFTIGEVDGEPIDLREFQLAEGIFQNTSDPSQTRSYLWQHFAEEKIVNKEAEALGLSVSEDELNELQFGNNLSPIIRSRMANPQTGQVDRAQLDAFKAGLEADNLDERQTTYWNFQKKEIRREALTDKLTDMVSKSLYTPGWMVEQFNKDQNGKRDIAYIKLPFDQIDDSEATLTDKDYSNYFNANKNKFYNEEENKEIEYTIFDVFPSAADSAALYEDMAERVEAFRTTDDDSTFVEINYGTIDAAFVKPNTLSPAISERIQTMEPGEVYGPYIDGKAYKLVKLMGKQMVPDSVDSRHILKKVATQEEFNVANKLIDSLQNVLEGGGDFNELAINFSDDGSAAQGGNLGYYAINQTVKPFNDVLFFTGEKGQYYKVFSQFGIHLIEILGKKFETKEEGYQVAYISQNIVPSDDTQEAVYDKINDFIGDNRDLESFRSAVASNPALSISKATINRNDYVVGSLERGQNSRELVKWAFDNETEIGEVNSTVFTFDDPVDYYRNKFVAAVCTADHPKGQQRLEDVKSTIEPLVRNNKKAVMLNEQIAGKGLDAIASQFSTNVDTIRNLSFYTNAAGKLGNEPEVIAATYGTAIDGISPVVAGNNGFYIVKPIAETPVTDDPNIANLKRTATASIKQTLKNGIMQSLKRNTKISDSRFDYY